MTISKRGIVLGGVAALALAACGRPAGVQEVVTGAQAPEFSITDATGAVRTLAEFAGRHVILEWTNAGCPYVRKHYDAGNMQALQRDAAARGVAWLQVISSAPGEQGHLDGPAAIAQVATDQATVTATLLDPDGAMGRAYGALNTPQMVMIDPEGRIIYQGAIDDRPSARPETLEGATNYVRAAWADMDAGRPVQIAQTQPYGCSVKYAS
ncbi:MAG: alkyl hydroperoxide reductase [Proteobacteria bacterium HN_bin10]|nr:MAG: alkyl hydroperoxide reductase [Proteobacteria bacterium HN_bin10]